MADVFTSELAFEDALVSVLEKDYGWKNGTFNHPTEQDLLDNWASILYENNRGIDRLNGEPRASHTEATKRLHQRQDGHHYARQRGRPAAFRQAGEPAHLRPAGDRGWAQPLPNS